MDKKEDKIVKPIILSKFGETLLQYPGEEHDDNQKMSSCIGVHEHCRGWIDLMEVSNTHNAVLCRKCGLRVVVPAGLKTYGDLRRHMEATLH